MKKIERKDRNEKRRLQLSKRPAEGEVTAKTLDLNKRVIAFIIAFAMILAMLPAGIFMHVRAGAADQLDPVTMWVRMNGVDNWDEVTVNPGKITENIGAVDVDNMPDGAEFVKAVIIDHDTGIETEIKSLGAIGNDYYYSLNDETNAGTKLDKSHEELLLIYGNRYRITENKTGSGDGTYEIVAHTDDQGKYLWAKEDLVVQKIEPAQDSKIDGVSFRSGASNGTVEIKDGAATIPYSKIKGNITVNLQFDAVNTYSITEGNVSQGNICQELGIADYNQTTYDSQDVDGVAPGETASFYVFSQSWTGGDAWILNQLTLNGENINLPSTDDINNYPNNQGDTLINNGPSAETTLSNGSVVTVQLVAKGRGMFWKTGDADYHKWGIAGEPGTFDKWEKYRCIYEVTITDVHEDYVVDGNFKDSSKREIIVKGLEGIDKTAAAVEDIRLISGFSVMQRYYTFTSNEKNIYTANYTRPVFNESIYPSDNLILYTVKYGYNPYTVTTAVAYGNGEASEDSVRDATRAGKPVEVIQNAKTRDYVDDSTGRYDTSFRHWGKNSVLQNQESTYRPSFEWGSKDLLLTTASKDTTNDWYAVALAQNAAKDQQLYLNASPYNFRLQLDVTGGEFDSSAISFADDRFAGDLTAYLETDGHTVVGSTPYTYLPDAEPTMDKYAFEYWQLTDAEGNPIEATRTLKTQYQPMDRLTLSEEMVNTVIALNETEDDDKYDNDKTIYLKAVWAEVQESTKTKVEIASFTQVAPATEGTDANPVSTADNKAYRRDYHQIETQNVGPVALLNLHQPTNSEYYVLNESLSKLKTDAKVVDVENDKVIIPKETNLLALYYDYKTVTLDLQKVVKGKPKSTDYTITLTLTKPAESPVSVEEALAMLNLSTTSEGVSTTDSTITITKKYGKNSRISFENVPYNWAYHVLEDVTTDANDYTSTDYDQAGYLTDNTKLIVTNTGNNPGIETDKKLTDNGDGTYNIDLAAYATGESYTEQLDSNVPLDIAIVLDQSGSMATSDVYKYDYVNEGNNHQTAWTVNEATGKYVKIGTKYYQLESYSATAYKLQGLKGDYLPYDMTTGFRFFNSGDATNYYAVINGEMKQLYVETSGYMAGFSSHSHTHLFQPTTYDPQYISGGGYHLWLKYYDGNTKKTLLTYEGYEEADYKADVDLGPISITDYITTYRLGADTYQQITVYGLRYKDDSGNYVYLSKPSDTITESNSGVKYYVTDQTSVFDENTDVTFVDREGRLNEEGQTLFTRTPITRVQALKQAVNKFVQEVGKQAKEANTDHRVAIIGFAGNETPGTSAYTNSSGVNIDLPYSNINGNKYITQNTGIFVDGQFKNYLTPDLTASGLGNALSTGSSLYTNLTYFYKDNTAFWPINYLESSERWYAVYTGSDGTLKSSYVSGNSSNSANVVISRGNNNYKYWYPRVNNQVYYPSVESLTSQDYQNALVKVKDNDSNENNVNDYIDTSIDTINAYGGTYLPYGLAMANNVFKNNDSTTDDGKARKRVVIVFSDGAPGGSGFEDAIANESLAAANLSKDLYGASVYTVGLYPNDTDSQITEFMHQLSSEYFTTTDNVYEENGGINSNGSYFFNDEDGRTHALTRYRKTSDVWFDSQYVGNRVIPVTEDSGGAHEQTTWFDSDGWVRAAYWNEDEANNPIRNNFYQFFTVGTPREVGEGSYYYSASDSEELAGIFETISTQLQHPTTTVKLDAYSSFMKDGISDNFDYSNAQVTLTTYDASESNIETKLNVEQIKGLNPSDPSADGATVDWDKASTNYLTVNGFDYSKYYIGKDHDGKILVATITGLKLKEGVHGAQIASNTTDSGVYKKDGDTSKMVAEFPQQYTSAGTYSAKVTLNYVGNRKIEGQKFNVEFKLTKSELSDYESYSGNFGGITFNSKGIFSTKMADGTSKEISGIPKDAVLTVTVSDPDNANTYYTYLITDTINNGDQDITTTLSGEDPRIGSISIEEDHPNILISVTDNRQPFTVTNHTQGQPGESDFSDKTKKFPITLTLYKNGETEPVSGEVSLIDQSGENIVFENGEYTAELADNETLALFAPEGYTIKVEDKGTFNYSATYQMDTDEEDTNSRTAVFNEDSRENGHAVNVYHTVNSVVISGIMDKAGKINPFIWAAIVVALAGAVWLMIMDKRKRQTSNH